MHHLCHIFASKRLPSKLYPPSTKPIQVPCFPNQSFTYPLILEGWTPPKNIRSIKHSQQKKQMLMTCYSPHMHPHSRAASFKMPNNHRFRFIPLARVLSSSAQLANPHANLTPNNPTPTQFQPNQPNNPANLTPNNQPNSNSNYQLPGTKSQRRCCRRNPWVRHLGGPQISELNRFTNRFTGFCSW